MTQISIKLSDAAGSGRLRAGGGTSRQALAQALTERSAPTPQNGMLWTHTIVGRLPAPTTDNDSQPAVPLTSRCEA